jgi:hypothetical protein
VREQTLDPPSTGEVGVSLRQRHDGVQVIGQDDDRVDRKWPFTPRRAKGGAQGGNVLDEHGRLSVRKGDGEKERPARNEVSSVPDHVEMVSRWAPARSPHGA